MTLADRPTIQDARSALAAEWASAAPATPDEVLAFYEGSQQLQHDLDAWHREPERRSWTEMLVYIAGQIGAKRAVDIGAGAGYDLKALRDAGLSHLCAVEPNQALAWHMIDAGIVDALLNTVDQDWSYVEQADLLVCFDVLEHVPDPEAFLGSIAHRARLGAVLVETTATSDIATPLHLEANRGWHPGHCLDAAGWVKIDQRDRVRVWQRVKESVAEQASVLLCAYRACSIPTMQAILALGGSGWRFLPKWGDALISRARSQIVSAWHAETADDVFLMIDDDITFRPEDAERIVALAREHRSIVCAAYPVGDGGHTAIRSLNRSTLEFGPGLRLVEVEYAATGFVACHRDVIDALAPTLPLCHPDQSWGFRPYFLPMVAPMSTAAGIDVDAYLSEDWAFSLRARQQGFRIWLDPTITLGHQKQAELTVKNMTAFHRVMIGEPVCTMEDHHAPEG